MAWPAAVIAGLIAKGANDTFNMGSGIFNYVRQGKWYEESLGREDTSVQRRVADLKAAGLNPVLAAGQSATTMPPVQRQAPNANDPGVMEAAMAMAQMDKDFAKKDAEIATLNANKDLASAKAAESAHNLNWAIEHGLTTTSSGPVKQLNEALSSVERMFGVSGKTGETIRNGLSGVRDTLNSLNAPQSSREKPDWLTRSPSENLEALRDRFGDRPENSIPRSGGGSW